MLLHDESPATVELRDWQFILPSYKRTKFHPRSGKGARLTGADGTAYWDLLGGIAVNVLGHQHPKIVRTLRAEAANPLHISNLYYHPAQGLLAQQLVEKSLLSRVFFCNSGTEANEAAMKFARLANPGRSKIVALNGSFHGRTLGALSITGNDAYRGPFEPMVPGVTFVDPNDSQALEKAVSNDTSAIFLEPILGEGGVVVLSDEYLGLARALADRTGAILVFDEIQCGLGRTGNLFAFQSSGVVPDIVTLAKALGGGLPLGAVITGPALEGLVKPGHHGTTFGGNPLACRLGLAVLSAVEDERLLDRVKTIGQWFGTELRSLQERCNAITDVRGTGMMWGIELTAPAAEIAAELMRRGFIVGTARENVIRLLPPYVVPRKALKGFVQNLELILLKYTNQTNSDDFPDGTFFGLERGIEGIGNSQTMSFHPASDEPTSGLAGKDTYDRGKALDQLR
ncbi:MAG: acetylornithine/succinylornithine family transaminase [Acidobacteriota bacterium]